MKPTVGRIVHTRLNGKLVAGIITAVPEYCPDTKDGSVTLNAVTIFPPSEPPRYLEFVSLYDTEYLAHSSGLGSFFWPERV